jgi:threonine dehydrogenase-like Zn-dependent dehydrogenase
MKAISLQPHTKNLTLKEWQEPLLTQPNQIKAQVLQVGICGTDREEASGGRADAPPGEKELIIGHEMVGKVYDVGKEVRSFKKGDFVVITVRRGCGSCPACQMERSDMCTTGRYTERGIKGRHGFQCQFVVDEEKYAIKVDPALGSLGVLAEPMSVVQKAIDEVSSVQKSRLPYLGEQWLKGKKALIAGLGPIGLLAALTLRLRGASVIGLDVVSETSPRAQILTQIGGTYVNDKTAHPCPISPQSIDLILDAAGIAKLNFDLLSLLAINGAFVLTGVPGDQRLVQVDGAKLMRQMVLGNQVMIGSVNESIQHFETGIADLQEANKRWPGILEKLITKRVVYTEFEQVMTHHGEDEIKVVVEWST